MAVLIEDVHMYTEDGGTTHRGYHVHKVIGIGTCAQWNEEDTEKPTMDTAMCTLASLQGKAT